jgi:predicted small secreted protein
MADDVDLDCVATRRPCNSSASRKGKALPFALAAAAVALAGCNASQGVNVSAQTTAPGVVAGPYFPNYNPYNPIEYAQTSGVYGGR